MGNFPPKPQLSSISITTVCSHHSVGVHQCVILNGSGRSRGFLGSLCMRACVARPRSRARAQSKTFWTAESPFLDPPLNGVKEYSVCTSLHRATTLLLILLINNILYLSKLLTTIITSTYHNVVLRNFCSGTYPALSH